MHAAPAGQSLCDRLAVGEPESDMIECLRVHAETLASGYRAASSYFFLASTERCSCALVICERPGTFSRLASLYSCSFVRPFGRLVPERSPPRRPDEMSRVDVREAPPFVSPARARSLLTVRAAISFARFVERPCFFSDSLTCSY